MNVGKKLTTMKVHVTQQDIDKGTPGSCGGCPVALALSRTIGREAWVAPIDFLIDGNGDTEISLPEKARQFIRRFDGCVAGAIEPFMFDVRVPLALLQQNNICGGTGIRTSENVQPQSTPCPAASSGKAQNNSLTMEV